MKLNVKAFALACGLLWGFGLLFLAWWLMWLEEGTPAPCLLNRMYPGYHFTPVGSLIGLGWGFVDAGIGGLIFAWLYNLLAGKFTKKT